MSTQTLTLAEFLLARIAADQEWAERWIHPSHSTTMCGDCALAQQRILADCEAKRRIVDYEVPWPGDPDAETAAYYACQCLALIYADHPDYRQEWRP